MSSRKDNVREPDRRDFLKKAAAIGLGATVDYSTKDQMAGCIANGRELWITMFIVV